MSEIDLDKKTKKNSYFTFKNIGLGILAIAISAFFFGFGLGVSKYLFADKEEADSLQENSMIKAEEKVLDYDPAKNSISYIFEDVSRSVVSITSTEIIKDFFSNNYESISQGSGVIIDDADNSLTIITNYHVVQNSAKIVVHFDENVEVEAFSIGKDEDSDLAFLSVDKSSIPEENLAQIKVAKLGDSENLKVGENVLAIGSPLGYKNTVTDGIISGLQRNLNFSDRRIKLIQTNAAINPGNSGGALVNMDGEVIGINTVKIAGTQVEGLAFAIPINNVKDIYEEILEKGYVSRPFLGIMGSDINRENSQYDFQAGVLVRGIVENSAAKIAGINEGDIIIEFNQEKIMNMEDLAESISKTKVGDKVKIIIIRSGQEQVEVEVTMRERE